MMNFLGPYIGAIKAALLVAVALALFGAGHHFGAQGVQNAWNAEKVKTAEAAAKAEAANRAKELAMQTQVEKAQNDAKDREKKLLADAAAAHAESDGLRHSLADLRSQLPSLTEQAVRQYADTASIVLGECTAAYQGLAEQADRIDSDRQTLEDAWPK